MGSMAVALYRSDVSSHCFCLPPQASPLLLTIDTSFVPLISLRWQTGSVSALVSQSVSQSLTCIGLTQCLWENVRVHEQVTLLPECLNTQEEKCPIICTTVC